jgi:hypothetical protein
MNSGEILVTVNSKISLDLPGLAPVEGLLHIHGGGPVTHFSFIIMFCDGQFSLLTVNEK